MAIKHKNNLAVSEQFYSIQGEGRHVGRPSVFLRLKGCNLRCGDSQSKLHTQPSTWICDTIDVWTKGESISFESLLTTWIANGWFDKLHSQDAALIITGGEPLLHNLDLNHFFDWLAEHYPDFHPIIELETNGTLFPEGTFNDCCTVFNVSPKLSNSGMANDFRLNMDILDRFNQDPRTQFKLVVTSKDDVLEFQQNIQHPLRIPPAKISLMPGADSRDELQNISIKVVDWCKEYGYHFSPRLHVDLWNQLTGV